MKKLRRRSSQEGQGESTITTPQDPVSSPAVPHPPLEWETTAQCLGPILRYNSLPLVLTCDRSGLPSLENINFDFTQPLLMHTRRTVRKVVSSSVMHVQQADGDTQLKQVGDQLLIPEDYKGWFAVLGSPRDVKPDRVVPHFRQVAQLALSRCERFLVGGQDPVMAVQMSSSEEGSNKRPQPRLIYPGDVLRMGKLYVGESTFKKNKLFGGKKEVKKEEKFLLCTDDKDRDVYLPVANRGTFYMVTTEGGGTPKIPIMRMPDICARFPLPCVVKLLFGRVPSTPCSFTGTLVLKDSEIENSVIGSTMLNLRNILLDIPIDTELKFFMAKPTVELLGSRAYKNAKTLCHDKANTYMRNMKVAYYVNEEDGLPSEASRGQPDLFPVSECGNNFSSPTKVLLRPRPSIVEDQDLFYPANSLPTGVAASPSTPGLKKAKKAIPSLDKTLSTDNISAAMAGESPTVLRKDKTFNLPEQDVLLLKPTQSMPSLSLDSRPLPDVQKRPQPSDTLPVGDYITMGKPDVPWTLPRDVRLAGNDSKQPPAPPTKPSKALLAAPPHNQSDFGPYSQIWDGQNKLCPAVQSGDKDTSEYQSPSPSLRPMRLDVPRSVHRVSCLAFDDTYLKLPVFKDSGVCADSPVSTQNSSSTSILSTSADSDSHTSLQAAESIYHTPRSKPVSARVPLPPGADDDQQPYENMSQLLRSDKDTQPWATGSNSNPPTPPPKARWRSQSSDSEVLPPLPPLPLPPAHLRIPPPIVFENRSSLFSDTSSLQSRGGQGQHEQPTVSNGKVGSPRTGPRKRNESYTYYEGCEDGGRMLSDLRESNVKAAVYANDGEQAAIPEADTEEILYENLKNLRLIQDKVPVSDNFPSNASDEVHGRFLDKLANSASVFGYLSPPRSRQHADNPSQASARPCTAAEGEWGQSEGDGLEEVTLQPGGSVLQLPPKQCRVAGTTAPGYLHACTEQNNNDKNSIYIVACADPEKQPFPPVLPRVRSGFSDCSSRASSADDLPLGATCANFRSGISDSGCPLESDAGSDNELSSLSVPELCDALKTVGLVKDTVDILRQEKVDGRLLASLDEEELKEALPGVKKLDIKKIRMFVNGWRPIE